MLFLMDRDFQGPGTAVLSHWSRASGAGLLPDIGIEEKSHHTVMKRVMCGMASPGAKYLLPQEKGIIKGY